jgi:hypothetical protein
MASEPRYSVVPTDWIEMRDMGKELQRVCGFEMVSGCMRLWVWLAYRGVEMVDGSVGFDRRQCSEEVRVGVKQVDRWRRELLSCCWIKAHSQSGRLWVHPSLRLKREGI